MFLKCLLLGFLLPLFSFAGFSQNIGNVDDEVKTSINSALSGYYAVKDALVNSDAQEAKQRAGELIAMIEATSDQKMTDSQKSYWAKVSTQLRNDTEQIRETGNIESQRARFVQLSNNFYSLISSYKANSREVYYFYCPMKKASWLSSSREVRNPYYGTKMIDCGSLRRILKK